MEIIADIFLDLVIWLIFFPVAWAASTPIILIGSCFAKDTYRISVEKKYRTVTKWCVKCGEVL